MASNVFKDIGDWLVGFVDSVKEALEDEPIRKSIADDIGLAPGESLGKPDPGTLSAVEAYRSNAKPDQEAFFALLHDVSALYDSVRTALSGFGPSNVERVNAVVALIFDVLAENYVRLSAPRFYFLIQALNVVVEDTAALDTDPFAPRRFLKAIGRTIKYLVSPIGYTYRSLAAGIEDEARAKFVSDRLFPQIAAVVALAKSLGPLAPIGTRDVIYGWDSLDPPTTPADVGTPGHSTTPVADRLADRMLSVAFPLSQEPTPTAGLDESVGFTLALVPKPDSAKPGLLIGVTGDGAVEFPISGRWMFRLQASAKPAFSLRLSAEDWNIDLAGHTPTGVPLNVAVVSIADERDVSFAVPDAAGTRLEIGEFAFSGSFDGTSGGLRAQALRCALVLATKDQDGFLAKILPRDGLRVPFSVGAGYSTSRRFFTEGDVDWPTGRTSMPSARGGALPAAGSPTGSAASARTLDKAPEIPALTGTAKPDLGLHAIIPIGRSLAGTRFDQLLLGVAPADDASSAVVTGEVSLSFTASIGPVQVTVDRIGLELGLGFPETGGNAGVADLSVGFRPPAGAGITVDSPFVSGGGFLFIDVAKGQYAGFVQLTVRKRLTITAIGIISTRLPGNVGGFSFVILITAQGFKPIPLGLGFVLTGIGGLLATNRTCNEEFLREGIKNRTLEALLFPADPVRNAVQIFGTLNTAFPPSPGSYLFGPVLRICWRTPPLITLDLGVILELGQRSRLVVLGRVSAIMPNEKHDLLRLQMNALGVVDFDQESASLDAVLYDSRVAGRFPITGSMAMRVNWSETAPQFALSIGGFHPAFKPPSNMPALQRLAITFSNTERYRLRGECYVAITGNTLQFGARMDLYVKVSGFSIEGAVGLDVLIQFSPFGFIAAFLLSFQIKRGSHNLFKVKIQGSLIGPRPLAIKGKATFEIFWVDFSLPIDHTFVEGEKPPAADPVAVTPRLVEALGQASSWTGQLAERDRRAVSLREPAGADVIPLHPLGRLVVKQTVVPLKLDIDRFADAPPSDARRFEIAFSLGGRRLDVDDVRDFFAPSQFLDLSDDEKLAAPSFEPMAAGVAARVAPVLVPTSDADLLEDDELSFETLILDSEFPQPVAADPAPADPSTLVRQLALGGSARARVRQNVAARYEIAGARNSATRRGWTLLSEEDGTPQAVPGSDGTVPVSYAEAFQALAAVRRRSPTRAAVLSLARVEAL